MASRASRPTLACLLLLFGCDNPNDETCPLGDEVACQGADGCAGFLLCSGAPAEEQTVCVCAPGSVGVPSSAEEPPIALGETCDTDEDCPDAATCLREDGDDLFGGGPPRGLCVVECADSPEKCEQFADAVCVIASEASSTPTAYCFPACTPGVEQLDKCGERTDLACERLPTSDGEGFCRPFCTRNDEGRQGSCDRRRGVCSASVSSGADLGQPCSPESEEPECAGTCLDLGSGYAVCSHRCAYGSADACTASGEAPGFCLFATPGGSLGDVGYCARVCDCDDECSHPRASCAPFTSDVVRELFDASGVCAPSDETGAALACSD